MSDSKNDSDSHSCSTCNCGCAAEGKTCNCSGCNYLVSNSTELKSALKNAQPGDVIDLKSGVYKGAFVAENFGRPEARIFLRGQPGSILTNPGSTALTLNNATYWHIDEVTISNSKRGILLIHSKNNDLSRIRIENVTEIGVAIREDSSDNFIQNSVITNTGTNTGKRSPRTGSAIVIGLDFRRWPRGRPDRSDRNVVMETRIGPGIPPDAVSLKEGTCCGRVTQNYFDGVGMRPKKGEGAWVRIRGNRYRVESNLGSSTFKDGFMVESTKPKQSEGCGNVFIDNACDLKSDGYCIKVKRSRELTTSANSVNPANPVNTCSNVVYSDNTYRHGRALTNIAVRKKRFGQKSVKNRIFAAELNWPLLFAFTFLPSLFLGLGLYLCLKRNTYEAVNKVNNNEK